MPGPVHPSRAALSAQPRPDLRPRSPGLPAVPSPRMRIELAELQHRSPRRSLRRNHVQPRRSLPRRTRPPPAGGVLPNMDSGKPYRSSKRRSSAAERCSGIVCGQSQFADEHAGCDQRRSLTSIHNERSASRVATCSAVRATTSALKQSPETSAAEIWAARSLTNLRRFFGNFVSVSPRSSAGAPDEGGRDSTAASCFQSPDSTQAPPNSRPTASMAKGAIPNNAATAPPRPARLYAATRVVTAAPASK